MAKLVYTPGMSAKKRESLHSLLSDELMEMVQEALKDRGIDPEQALISLHCAYQGIDDEDDECAMGFAHIEGDMLQIQIVKALTGSLKKAIAGIEKPLRGIMDDEDDEMVAGEVVVKSIDERLEDDDLPKGLKKLYKRMKKIAQMKMRGDDEDDIREEIGALGGVVEDDPRMPEQIKKRVRGLIEDLDKEKTAEDLIEELSEEPVVRVLAIGSDEDVEKALKKIAKDKRLPKKAKKLLTKLIKAHRDD